MKHSSTANTQTMADYEEMQRKLLRMVRFIEQEGHEKAEEVDARTEEEYHIEKGNLIQLGRIKINQEYEKKHVEFTRQEHTKLSMILSKSRQLILASRQEAMKLLTEYVKQKIQEDLSCTKRRWIILELLIMEGLFKLLEHKVLIKCREIDVNVITQALPQIQMKYERTAKKSVAIYLSTEYLPNEILPGVLLIVNNGRITVDNTLDSRVLQIIQFCMPVLNTIFYGTSKMRTSK